MSHLLFAGLSVIGKLQITMSFMLIFFSLKFAVMPVTGWLVKTIMDWSYQLQWQRNCI